MNKWASRAAAYFSEKAQEPTPISPESPLMGVMGVGVVLNLANDDGLLGVMGVPTRSIPKKRTHISPELIAAAMKACDHWGDSDSSRVEMRNQVLETPQELLSDLLDYFRSTYGGAPAKHSNVLNLQEICND